MSLARQKVVPLFPNSEYPLALPGEQLLVSVWGSISEYKVRLSEYVPVLALEHDCGDNVSESPLISAQY